MLDEKEHAIELFSSTLSGKKKILHNGRNIYEKRKYRLNCFAYFVFSFGSSNFNYSLNMGNHVLSVVGVGETFDLRIDNRPFQSLNIVEGFDKRRTHNPIVS